MTVDEIEKRARREALKHGTAAAIRKLLDAAISDEAVEDDADFESEVLELVTEEA